LNKVAPPAQAPMPAALKMAVIQTQQKAPGHDFTRAPGGEFHARAGQLDSAAEVTTTTAGVHLSKTGDRAFELGVQTVSVGRAGALAAVKSPRSRAEGQTLVLAHEGGIDEQFLAGPLGLEHSFTLSQKPAGTGELRIEVAFDGLAPEKASDDRVTLADASGQVKAGYRDLIAVDVKGHELAAHMELSGRRVVLSIDDQAATYPVLVDPVLWVQQQELVTGNGIAGDQFGTAVAVSGDTALVAAPTRSVGGHSSQGSVYVYVRSGTTWTLQQELTASDGASGDGFGISVALSNDTALVSALNHEVGSNSYQPGLFTAATGARESPDPKTQFWPLAPFATA
jgi:hypothetical protein